MNTHPFQPPPLSRREMLTRCGTGFGMMALASLMNGTGLLTSSSSAAGVSALPLAPRAPHFAPKAKRVVHLFMNGGPSQVDTFDLRSCLARSRARISIRSTPTSRSSSRTSATSDWASTNNGVSSICCAK